MKRKDYEMPRLERYGTLEELTAGSVGLLLGDVISTNVSDRALKEDVRPVDGEHLLRSVETLPIASWSYLGDRTRHIGPMAQDFASAFSVGADERRIHTVDGIGVGLGAIQALARTVRAQGEELERLRAELDVLREEVAGDT